MKNIKMNKAKVNASSPSPDDHERPSKRQKVDKSNSLNLNNSGNDSGYEIEDYGRIRRKCEEIRKELCKLEALEISVEEEREALKMQKQSYKEEIAQLQEDLQRSKRNEQQLQQLQEDLKRSERDKQQLQEDLVASRKNTRETIVQLQGDLDSSMREKEEARRSQISLESKLLQLKTIIEHDITPLIMDSSFVSTLTPSPSQEKVQESVPEALMEETFRSDTISQEELYSQGIQFTETTIEIQTTPETCTDGGRVALQEEGNRAGEPVEENTISSLLEAERRKTSSIQERIDKTEKLPQQVKILEKTCEILSPEFRMTLFPESVHSSSGGSDVEMTNLSGASLHEGSSFIAPDHSSTLLDHGRDETQEVSSVVSEEELCPSDSVPGVDEESSVIPEDKEQGADCPRNSIGMKYPIGIESRFFEINWKEEYTRTKRHEWVCKTCPDLFTSIELIKDHVWNIHYSGMFHCSQCTDSPRYKSGSRKSVREHIKKKHIQL